MKIKKKELRKREAQLPINYPDPDVLPDSLPGGAIDLEAEMVQVEILCKRLAHNEVAVRDAVLAEVPHYLERLTSAIAEMEKSYAAEVAEVQAYFTAHPKAPNPYRYENIPLALQQFREKAAEQERDSRRRVAMRELRHRQAQERREKERYGRYGGPAEDAAAADEDEEGAGWNTGPQPPHVYKGENVHRQRYQTWMEAWCDLELVFLKLCRGIHYCLWHSDKPLVQLACAQKIADLLHAPQTTRSKVLFYGSLFRVLAREWPTIDRYRMDKYLALVRRMVFAYVKLVKDVRDGDAAATAAVGASAENGQGNGKRARDGAADDAAAEPGETGTAVGAAWKTAVSVSQSAVRKYMGASLGVANVVSEILYILQRQIFTSTASIGLTMHICDVAFDELVRAELGANLFLALSAGIPLYAMSQGNYVEKRVLDSFFPPLAGGVYAQRRAEQLAAAMTAAAPLRKKRAGKPSAVGGESASSPEAIQALAEEHAAAEARTVMQETAFCCRKYAVARGVAYEVRPMFSEAELIMRQSADPESFQPLTRTAQRRRIERELKEVDNTRSKVRSERQAVRDMKKQDRHAVLKEKVKARKAAVVAEKGGKAAVVSKAAIRKQIIAEETRAKRKPVHNTKRKKAYHLTKQDLYGDVDA
ncbi:Nucleolar protein,Nop52 [Novymonas esmeraldas]|uniref:Nucleolar protein,Nop52 n=1 Tax=Novymonas esmeraldas TaxID=1808958 RepID=A0AAW0EKC1_9TRYP